MLDPRVTKLAEVLCDHSCRLDSSDTLLVHAFDIEPECVAEIVRVAQERGAKVAVRLESGVVKRQLMHGLTEDSARLIAEIERHEMEQMTSYIAIRGTHNYAELAEVSSEKTNIWATEYVQPVVFGIRVPNTKWAVLRWPTPGMAQQASMSTKAFEDFFFEVCTLDYAKMAAAVTPLEALMSRTDRVKITGPGTDLSFSIKDIGAIGCSGRRNIPDGECFTAPVRDSMNGVVQYNTTSLYQGTEFKDIRFVVENGKIVEATAGPNTEKLNKILDTDEGGRYFGEWALGFNPAIREPMLDTLFDEKIAGSFHLTPGNAYNPPGGNGNKSSIHWDIVCIQRPEYGGGEIYFDDVLIRKDGLFVIPELEGLNPGNF